MISSRISLIYDKRKALIGSQKALTSAFIRLP